MKRRRGEREIKGKKELIKEREKGGGRGKEKEGRSAGTRDEWREWGVDNHNQELEGRARSR